MNTTEYCLNIMQNCYNFIKNIMENAMPRNFAAGIIAVFCLFFTFHPVFAANLQIATDRWPPYENISNIDFPGYSTEIIRHVLDIMGVQADIKAYPWARGVEMVFRGQTDGLYSATFTEERARYCHFPDEPLLLSKYVFFIRSTDKDRFRFDSYDDLTGKQIGVVRGYAYSEEFWNFVKKNKNYQEVPTDEQNFKKLLSGRIDYLVADYGNGMALVREMELAGKVIPLLARPVREDGLYLIFSKRTTASEFVKRFSDTLREFRKTPTCKAINEKYLEKTP